MKKLVLFASLMVSILFLSSCGKDEYSFLGTWGVDLIKYYNIDYAGNAIESTITTYDFTPGDMENGIDLVFREDKTGEMRDRSRDTLFLDWNSETQAYETVIVCPDTTLVTKFTYSYNANDGLLFMNMQVEHPYIYQMQINFIDENTFVYVNEYETNYVEQAQLVRYSTETRGSKSSKPEYVPRHRNSLLTPR